jgi:polyhydroxyalkanoate synthesis regulator phasin
MRQHPVYHADCNHAEGIYGATELTRRVLAEVLAERVDRGEVSEDDAKRIGRQVMRENALALFPGAKAKLWRGKGKLTPAK